VGVDIAAEMLAIAQPRVPTGRFVVGDLCALPLPAASMAGAVPGWPWPTSATWRWPAGAGPGGARRRTGGGVGAAPAVRQHPHSVSDYLAAFVSAGWELRHCLEPQISPTAAAALRPGFADITQLALVGLPAVLVLDLERRRMQAP
jgi:hypothetical protein